MAHSSVLVGLVVTVLGILIAVRNKSFSILDDSGENKEELNLAICILSARDHFQHREAIRQSWLSGIRNKDLNGKKVVAKFVLGRDACLIHPDNRLSPHACDRWEPKLPDDYREVKAFSAISHKMGISVTPTAVTQNLYVKVMTDIVLKRLGLFHHPALFDSQQNQTFRVVLYDAVTEEEITQASFSNLNKGVELDGYLYRPVEEILLPKGYEFMLEVEGVADNLLWRFSDDRQGQHAHDVEESHHNLVFTQMTDGIGRVLSQATTTNAVPGVSFIFAVSDPQSLQRHVDSIEQRDAVWRDKMSSVASRLQAEMSHHDDIMSLDLQDVYRNLPQKVAMCHQRYNQHYVLEYVMKTDDDCLVNLPDVLDTLPESCEDNMTWWGNFRHYWSVERHGKWREERYSGTTYPQFACGSGSVVSRPVSSYLASNVKLLQMYQGEDVSVGVWLAGLNVQHRQDDRWRCDKSCRSRMLSLPELSPDQVRWHWTNKGLCPSGS